MYQRVSVIGVGIITVKQACQNLSLAAPLVFWPRAATAPGCLQANHLSPHTTVFGVYRLGHSNFRTIDKRMCFLNKI